MSDVLLVALGAAVGAPCRYLLDLWVQARHDSVFPWGTFLVNTSGSFGLGLLLPLAAGAPDGLRTLLGTGLLGAFTTYSTFGIETVRLLEDGALLAGALNVVAGVLAGLAACAGGYLLGAALA